MTHASLADLISATHESWKAATRAHDQHAIVSCAEHLEWLAVEALRNLAQDRTDTVTRRLLTDALRHVADDVPRIGKMLREAGFR